MDTHNVTGLLWCCAGDGKGMLSNLQLFDSGEEGAFTSSPMLLFLALTSSLLQNVTITVNGTDLTVKLKPELKYELLTLSQLFSIAYMVRTSSPCGASFTFRTTSTAHFGWPMQCL